MEKDPRTHEAPADRARRIEWLREVVASGRYVVPAEAVARSLLRRLGLEALDLQHP
jgi:anti-sigma28 factor (negative regulator of flagellin synthesis)